MPNAIEKKLGYTFKNIKLLKEALTHRSYINENRSWDVPHNERLEFLGDSVLELVVTDYLFQNYPKKQEGELTQMRAFLVSGERALATVNSLGMNDFLFVSRGESKNTGARKVLLANAFEAVIGAIYLDGGLLAAREFIYSSVIESMKDDLKKDLRDPKSRLQETLQSLTKQTPRYEILSSSGPNHEKTFVIGVYADAKLLAKGTGPSRLKAENEAAILALKSL